jgi:PilZ domain
MHLTDDDLRRYADKRTGSQEPAFVAHLAGCEHCRYRLLRAQLSEPLAEFQGTAGALAINGERRRAVRLRFHERASLTRLNPLVMDRWRVHVLNISRGGLKLHVPQALEPGATVQIRLHVALVTAEVRYCVRVGAEFQAGVRSMDVFFIDPDRLQDDRRPSDGLRGEPSRTIAAHPKANVASLAR